MTTRVCKVMKDNEVLFMLTYRCKKVPKIEIEEVAIYNSVIRSVRHYGKSPVVFIEIDKMNDLEILNKANLIYTSIENISGLLNETKLTNTIKIALNNADLKFTYENFHDELGFVKFRNPHKDFITFRKEMFVKATREVVERTVLENGKEATRNAIGIE